MQTKEHSLIEQKDCILIFFPDRQQQGEQLATQLRTAGIKLATLAELQHSTMVEEETAFYTALYTASKTFVIIPSRQLSQDDGFLKLFLERLIAGFVSNAKKILPVHFSERDEQISLEFINLLVPARLYGPTTNQQLNVEFIAKQSQNLLDAIRTK
jgi:hypothetical protein